MGVGGQIWGPGPPKWIFFIFHFTKNSDERFLYKFLKSTDIEVPCDPWNFGYMEWYDFFEKKGIENFGGVALFRFHPLGGLPSPIWPLQMLVLGTLTKIVFVRGGSPPIWGRYEFWPVCTLAHFFLSYRNFPLAIFCQSTVRTAYFLSWQFSQNRNSTIRANFAQILKKTR